MPCIASHTALKNSLLAPDLIAMLTDVVPVLVFIEDEVINQAQATAPDSRHGADGDQGTLRPSVLAWVQHLCQPTFKVSP